MFTEDRVRDAAAERDAAQADAEIVRSQLAAAQAALADVTREREELAATLELREAEVRCSACSHNWCTRRQLCGDAADHARMQLEELRGRISAMAQEAAQAQDDLAGERCTVARLEAAAVEAAGELETAQAAAAAAGARADAADAAAAAVEAEKEAAEEDAAAQGDRADELASECSDLHLQIKVRVTRDTTCVRMCARCVRT
jgi:chromosome segregation ATPase